MQRGSVGAGNVLCFLEGGCEELPGSGWMRRIWPSRREYFSPRSKARKGTVSAPLGDLGCFARKMFAPVTDASMANARVWAIRKTAIA
jgi:hypothetical protein